MNKVSPRILMSVSFISWAILCFISPIKYTHIYDYKGPLLLGLFILFFLGGTFFTNCVCYNSRIIKSMYWSPYHIPKKFLCFLVIISAVGILLRYYDLIVLKQYISYGSISAFRLNYIEYETGLISIISALLSPIIIACQMITIYYYKNINKAIKIIVFFLFLTYIFYFVLRGSRLSISLITVTLLFTIILSNRFYLKIRIRSILIIIVIATILFMYFVLVFNDRLDAMGYSPYNHLIYSQLRHHFIVENNILEWTLFDSNIAIIAYSLIMLNHYFVHGVYEFFSLVYTFNTDNIVFGFSQYYPIFKLLNYFGFQTITQYDLLQIIERVGVYQTFFGPVLIDYGIIGGAGYCFIIGMLSQYSWIKALKRNSFHLLIYPLIGSIIIHFSYVNMIQNGMGLYILVSLICVGIILNYLITKKIH